MIETTYTIPNAPHIALLTDFHAGNPTPVIASLRRHRDDIDLITIAGDFIYGSVPDPSLSPLDVQKSVLPFIRFCSEMAPTYVSLGNHEWRLDSHDMKRIASTGAIILDNTYTTAIIHQRTISIAGLTSGYVLSHGRDRTQRADLPALKNAPSISWLEDFSHAPGFKLLLSHHPEYVSCLPPCDLVVSGHTHGGQWRYYSLLHREWRGVFSPGQGLFPKYSRGFYEKNKLVVSAGLTNTARIPRIFNPVEIVYII